MEKDKKNIKIVMVGGNRPEVTIRGLLKSDRTFCPVVVDKVVKYDKRTETTIFGLLEELHGDRYKLKEDDLKEAKDDAKALELKSRYFQYKTAKGFYQSRMNDVCDSLKELLSVEDGILIFEGDYDSVRITITNHPYDNQQVIVVSKDFKGSYTDGFEIDEAKFRLLHKIFFK